MSQKRKISIRKVLQTLLTIIVAGGCAVAMISADRLQSNKKVAGVRVHIRNSDKVHFLDEAQVMSLLFNDRHINPEDLTLAHLDIHKMESIARTNPWVSDAQVYVDNERRMQIYITQRVPVVRLFEETGNSYYLDTALRSMPLSTTYVHYTPVVTGAPQLRDDSLGTTQKGTILCLVNYITRHPFWNAQIAQIVVAGNNQFELIPVLGNQRILLGDTVDLEHKLSNLFSFYQQVCNKVGWDKYKTIDLRYTGQVVASPALAWKAPVDRVLSNMNWVKAVLDAGDKKEKDESAIADSGAPATDKIPVRNALPAIQSPAAAVKLVATAPAAAAIKPTAALKGKDKVKGIETVKKAALGAKPKAIKPIVKESIKKPDPKKKESPKESKKEEPGKKKKDPKKKIVKPENQHTNH